MSNARILDWSPIIANMCCYDEGDNDDDYDYDDDHDVYFTFFSCSTTATMFVRFVRLRSKFACGCQRSRQMTIILKIYVDNNISLSIIKTSLIFNVDDISLILLIVAESPSGFLLRLAASTSSSSRSTSIFTTGLLFRPWVLTQRYHDYDDDHSFQLIINC